MSSANLFYTKLFPSLIPKSSLSSLSLLSLSLSIPSVFLQFPRSSLSISRLAAHNSLTNSSIQESENNDEESEETEAYESDSDDYAIDIDALEQEAEDVVREYSTSLSRQLRIEDDSDDKKETRKQKRQKFTIPDIPDNLLPRVAIVGRPNVGKSALFNRLVGGNKAIVVDEPGVTRDRLYGRSFWGDFEFMVVDTGGVLTISQSQDNVMEDLAITTTIGMDGIPLASREAAVARMPSMIERQAAAAVEESSVIIFLVDGQAGLIAADIEIADWLRKNYSNKFIILAVNKCESPKKGIMQAAEFWSLGLSPIPISALSGTGTGELLDLVCSQLAKVEKFRLIDTAGIRRRAAVASSGSLTEALSVNRAFRAIRRSDVVALVIEAMACITEQDFRIADRIEKEGKGCLIVVNKWDTIPNKNQQTATYYEQDVREKLRILQWAPIVYSTAIADHSVEKIIIAASAVEKERSRRLSTAILNQVVREALAFKSPPRTRGGRRGRVYYCTQAAIRPPTFVFFVNDASLFPETYRRFMEKQLRSDAGFSGTPIRLLWRSRRKMEKGGVKSPARSQLNLTPRG
ncbi:GTPase Der isoform X2 [Ricinus communis]|uniref:GTPase Der isoform X2 n=1 Tax=Ricinus communis TaxID=3988 RepID=UPI00201A5C5C|nr:GTPase Der isoform X2 [Ricinus communis]